jgi:antitoxin (DNA-binding transcriptional repressor) of toxin-antitoxin stability system
LKKVLFSDFMDNISMYFSDVEKGETLLIIRHGKAIAIISPSKKLEPKIPAWKMPGLKLSIKGLDLSKAILEDR